MPKQKMTPWWKGSISQSIMAKQIKLGNGADVFTNASDPEFANGDSVSGQNGADSIDVSGKDLTVLGENGNDSLVVGGEGSLTGGPDNNVVDGGLGDDVIEVNGFGNTVRGGKGADSITSYFVQSDRIGEMFYAPGNQLSGGKGMDSFQVVNSSDLIVDIYKSPDLDPGAYSQVIDGMVVQGVFDVITDYQAGERIDIDASVKTNIVGLDDYGFNHLHLALEDDSYAVLKGTYNPDGSFLVGGGFDALLVWDSPQGDSSGPMNGYEGALCILATDPNSLMVV